ncbi:hypothetical protein YK48G_17210 [Lentilactobacillus fungorum]|uniref:Uncharacterized protein n=1 Tax=Lentilactobacillus fungorum TaxID=2201250 RepID=A0ABQ3W1H8_9LACO|nr:hypothetical protein [Lentilactobacillus fungorum]GHP14296.1 hypothetical protein YK48G_17210 [Lentilactobacillus fungorum]
MDELDKLLIKGYMHLSDKIQRQQKRFEYAEWLFWQQSFMSCPDAFDANGNPTHVARYDKQVDALIDLEAQTNLNADILTFKRDYFQKFLHSLPAADYDYLRDAYYAGKDIPNNPEIDQQALNECNQIEEATGYRFNLPVTQAVDITADINRNMRQVLGMLG